MSGGSQDWRGQIELGSEKHSAALNIGAAGNEKLLQFGRAESPIELPIELQPDGTVGRQMSDHVVEEKFPFPDSPQVCSLVVVETNRISRDHIGMFSERRQRSKGTRCAGVGCVAAPDFLKSIGIDRSDDGILG